MRRGILGGTFDPPHLVHLVAGEAAFHDLGLDIVTFIPAGDPWQKADLVVGAAHHRHAMTALATAGVDYFEVDDREIRRPGPTYTVDTLAEFPASDDLTLVLGADAAAGIPTWKDWKTVVARARIAVVPRPGIAPSVVDTTGIDVTWLNTPALDISGTMLRERARAGHSIRFFVPEAVWRYIADEGLYGGAG